MALTFSNKGSAGASSSTLPATPPRPTSSQEKKEGHRLARAASARARGEHTALGTLLLEQDLINAEQLAAAVEQQRRTGRRIGQVLIDMGATTADAVLGALSVQLGIPGMRVNAYTVDHDALRALPEKVARKHGAFPLLKAGPLLTVAMASLPDLDTLDDLRFASACEIRTVIALEDEIATAINRYYASDGIPHQLEQPGEPVIVEAPALDRRKAEDGDRRKIRYGRRATDVVVAGEPQEYDEAAERSAVVTVDRLLARAAADGASDVHLDPTNETFRVRFRVDGTFRDVATFVPALAPAIVARIKVLSGMDIAEHRLPQDGRFSAIVGQRRIDLRTATYPTMHGEKAVLRLLDRSALRLQLDTMGMRGSVLERFRDLIRRPEGMLLITGPTGSGKTSTLYAALTEIIETGKHIITIEDPVEYSLQGVNQGQTNEKAGFTFARGLRAILRQDPDVIMVGEIRDPVTLETAVEASLTGHLVFSTLHTNSAIGTVARLVDMGLEPYLLAASLLGTVAQRLVRRICPTCRIEVPLPPGVAHLFGDRVPDKLYRGQGCHDCRGTGYRGRVAVHELVAINEELRYLIMQHAAESKLLDAAACNGTVTLRTECLSRVIEGETTLEEMMRLTQERA